MSNLIKRKYLILKNRLSIPEKNVTFKKAREKHFEKKIGSIKSINGPTCLIGKITQAFLFAPNFVRNDRKCSERVSVKLFKLFNSSATEKSGSIN